MDRPRTSARAAGRVRAVNDAGLRGDGDYVVYWMIAARRTRSNFALEHAADTARELGCGLVVLEPLRCGYRWASDRLHRFVIEGMRDNAARCEGKALTYYPYLEPEAGAGQGLLACIASRATLVVTDDYPTFFLPRMVAAAGRTLDVALEAVDSNGLLPLSATGEASVTAYQFRRMLQKTLREHLDAFPKDDPIRGLSLPHATLPREVRSRWPPVGAALDGDLDELVADLPIDHDVPCVAYAGGDTTARRRLARWLEADDGLAAYGEGRNHPDDDASSGLSPWLHFGHLSAHEVVRRVLDREDWTPDRLASWSKGSREGWWGLSSAAEAFLDELVTWRELGYHFCRHRDDHGEFGSLPDWARTTLAEHAEDEREHVYDRDAFERAETHDEIWNAAQRQLRREGRIHNYLRMLWGKKILHWTASPRDALEIMTELNDRWAVDGRDPNSSSGIFWVLGRFDRAWGPEREVFGKVRYMTSDSTRKKLRLSGYLERFGPDS